MSRAAGDPRLAVDFCGISFQNPILLAAGTAAYGAELDQVMHLDRLGGIILMFLAIGTAVAAKATIVRRPSTRWYMPIVGNGG